MALYGVEFFPEHLACRQITPLFSCHLLVIKIMWPIVKLLLSFIHRVYWLLTCIPGTYKSIKDCFYPRDLVSAVLATATWLAGWLDVTRQYCIKTTKPILKLFWPSGSPIVLVSSDSCADTQFQGELLQRGLYIHGVGKIGDFLQKSLFILEMVRDSPMVSMEC